MNLNDILSFATGQWPDSIFSNDFSYEFTGLNFDFGKSNKSDLKYLLRLVDDLGSQLYIRDVSFLGFNSYYIVAPGLSQDIRRKTDYSLFQKLELSIGKINNASSLSADELLSLDSILEEYYIAIKEGDINFEEYFLNNTDEDATDLSIDLFLSMVNYKSGNIDKAYLYLTRYLQNKDVQDYLYFYACKDYLALLKNGENEKEIQSYMSKIYSNALANEVIEDMFDADNIFKEYNLQWYFDCRNCEIEEYKYYNVVKILKNIEKKHKAKPIDQMNLSKIFYSN